MESRNYFEIMQHTIGIDFGTTKTMVSYLNPATGRPELVRLGRDRDSIPTTVHVDEVGAFLFGEDADDQIEMDTEGYCRAFKLHLGEKEAVLPRLGITAESLTARFLQHIKDECEQSVFHGDPVSSATITIPVSFSPARKASLKRAAETAGFAKVSFLPEPEAAGVAFLRDNPQDKFSRALVLDWGGGTLDIAIISRDADGNIHADRHCAEGCEGMGGEEMDIGLLQNIATMWEAKYGTPLIQDMAEEVRFLRVTQKVKEMLSKKDPVSFRRGTKKQEISREKFNHVIGDLLEEVVRLVTSALAKNKAQGNFDPDALILIGGSCQIPAVREVMEQNFPNLRVLSWHHSHEAVALGASQVDSIPSVTKNRLPLKDNDQSTLELAEKVFRGKGSLSGLRAKEVKIIEKMAQAGNPHAAGILAQIYHDGCEGCPQNLKSSYEWAKIAANAGDSNGQRLLVLYYLGIEENNNPVQKSRSIAREWAQKAYSREKSIENTAQLLIVLSSFDNPNTARIEELGNEILNHVGEKTPGEFAFDERDAIGITCFILFGIVLEHNNPEKALQLLEKGADFGNKECIETLSEIENSQSETADDSFAVTDEAIRLFAHIASTATRRVGHCLSQAQKNFIARWCPDIYSNMAWMRPFDSSEDARRLADNAARSYCNDQAQLNHLFSVLRSFAMCDGFIDNEVKTELMLISNVFGIDSHSFAAARREVEVPIDLDDGSSPSNVIRLEQPSVNSVTGGSPSKNDDSWGVGTGAMAGAAIGTIIPGIGTVLGAGIGAGVGWIKKYLK